jgi:hypothetical protein
MQNQQGVELVEDMPFVTDEPADDPQMLVTIDADSGEIEEEEMPEDTPENRAILDRVKNAKHNLTNQWLQLAADLYEVQEKKLHRLAGFEKLDQYFSHVIDNTPRYGFELTALHKYFHIELKGMLVDRPEVHQSVVEKIKNIGVTKTKEIAKGKIKDPDVLVQLIDEISQPQENGYMATVEQVKEKINNYKLALKETVGSVELDEKERKRKERQEQNKKEIFKFKIPYGQAEKVKEALSRVITKHGMDDNEKSKSLAFFRICEEWQIENQAAVDGTRPGLESELKRLEDIYSCKLVAFPADASGNLRVDAEGMSIMFGEETFAEIVAEDDEPAEEKTVS